MPAHRSAPSCRVLLAFDKFKGTLTSYEAADAIAGGLAAYGSALQVSAIPVADGGDGTIDAAVAAGYERRSITVTGPLGAPVDAAVAMAGHAAIVEVAGVCGLGQLPAGATEPLRATSHGVGELILELADRGITDIVLGLGGSATTDGGTGMLRALGVTFRDAMGTLIGPGGGDLHRLDAVDWSGLDPRVRRLRLTVASDVDNPLLGPAGAARVFGPQKGADPDDVACLEAGLEQLVSVLERTPAPSSVKPSAKRQGGGAAGGIGFGAYVLGAHPVAGARFVLDLLGLSDRLGRTDVVITGEGRLDSQSLRGKAPIEVVRAATARGIPVVGAVGQCTLGVEERTRVGLAAVWAMNEYDARTADSATTSSKVLSAIGEEIAESLVSTPRPGWSAAQHEFHDAMRHRRTGASHDTDWESQCPS